MRDTSSGRARVNPTGVRVAWTEARNAAVGAVHRGWPVVPGTCRPDEMGFSQVGPLEDTWDLASVTDPEQAEDIWTRVLLSWPPAQAGRGLIWPRCRCGCAGPGSGWRCRRRRWGVPARG